MADALTRPVRRRPPGPIDDAARGAAPRRPRRLAASTAPELVRVGMNAIFAAGDVVLRVGRPTAPAEAAIELAAVLAEHGVRVPAPVRDERSSATAASP